MTPPRSERFEMRLEPSLLEGIDEWRRNEGDVPSRADAVRRLIEAGLKAKRSMQPKISDGEKLLALMMGQIARKLQATDDIDPDFVDHVIFGGHYWALKWRYPGVFHGHMDREDIVGEVVDILDMWYFLESGFEKLSQVEKGRLANQITWWRTPLSFPGFDRNNESEHGSIMETLVDKLDRFELFRGRSHLNSHMPLLESYRRMLQVFRPIRITLTGANLSFSQFVAILTASKHP